MREQPAKRRTFEVVRIQESAAASCSARRNPVKGTAKITRRKGRIAPANRAAEPRAASGSRRLTKRQSWLRDPSGGTLRRDRSFRSSPAPRPARCLRLGRSTDPGRSKRRDGRLDDRCEAARRSVCRGGWVGDGARQQLALTARCGDLEPQPAPASPGCLVSPGAQRARSDLPDYIQPPKYPAA